MSLKYTKPAIIPLSENAVIEGACSPSGNTDINPGNCTSGQTAGGSCSPNGQNASGSCMGGQNARQGTCGPLGQNASAQCVAGQNATVGRCAPHGSGNVPM